MPKMKRVFTLLTFLFAVVSLVVLPVARVYSADCSKVEDLFSSTYDVTFSLQSNGDAAVTQKISLKNLSSDCFVSEFGLTVNSGRVQSVSGKDSLGTIKTSSKKEKDATIIIARLNDEVIGLGRAVVFTLEYTLKGLASKEGNIWRVSVPNIATSEEVTAYTLRVRSPRSFGNIFSTTIEPKRKIVGKDNTVLEFNKEILETQGVTIAFGDSQQIFFNFKLPLENKQLFRKKFQVPIPSDTDSQVVLLKEMKPKPGRIYLDKFGNYLAEYTVPARSFIEAQIEGLVKIIDTDSGEVATSGKEFSEEELKIFKEESAFVQVQESLIQEQAKKLEDTKKIYNFVTKTFQFDSRLETNLKKDRVGALSIVSNKDSKLTTTDFVDLFTAISRAAGMPTRQVIGLVVSKNAANKPRYVGPPLYTKSLHTWVQVYDKDQKTWFDVDPTWGNTANADYFGGNFTDRIALLFTDSTYGLENLESFTLLSDSVEVGYSSSPEDFTPEVSMDIDLDQPVAGFPADLEIKLANNKGVSLASSNLNIELDNLTVVGESQKKLEALLPFEKRVIKFRVRGGNFFGESQGKVKVHLVGGQKEIQKEQNVQIASLFSFGGQQISLIGILVLLILGNFAPRFFRKK